MLGLIERIERAQAIQDHWNNLKDRKRAYESNEMKWQQLFRQAGCETICTECLCIQETSISFVACNECGGDTVSPYYC